MEIGSKNLCSYISSKNGRLAFLKSRGEMLLLCEKHFLIAFWHVFTYIQGGPQHLWAPEEERFLVKCSFPSHFPLLFPPFLSFFLLLFPIRFYFCQSLVLWPGLKGGTLQQLFLLSLPQGRVTVYSGALSLMEQGPKAGEGFLPLHPDPCNSSVGWFCCVCVGLAHCYSELHLQLQF